MDIKSVSETSGKLYSVIDVNFVKCGKFEIISFNTNRGVL